MVLARRRYADAAGFCDALKPRGDVHAVAKDVVRLDDYVADIDADTESNTPVFRIGGCEFFDVGLELHSGSIASTAHGNSAKNPSPVFFTMRPPCSVIAGWTASVRSTVSLACVASSSQCMSRE
jgi:hypothetical protein